MTFKINDTIIKLPGTLVKAEAIHGIWLLIFSSESLDITDRGRNIWAFDHSGRFLWKIRPFPRLTPDFTEPWMNIRLSNDGKVFVGNVLDRELGLDLKTGHLLREDGVPFPDVETADELLQLEKQGKWPPKK